MAATRRKSARSLMDRLWQEPQSFSFFQAVRLLRLEAGRRLRSSPAETRGRIPVYFRASHSLGFPASEVVKLEKTAEVPQHLNGGAEAALTVAFLGLAGHHGPLPDHYAELLQERQAKRDFAMVNFLGIFNHRLLELFYQAFEKARFYIAFEQGQEDPLARALYALMGLGTPRLRRTTGFPADALLQFAGLLGRRPVSLATAGTVLRAYFGDLDFRLEQLTGCWVDLEPDSLCRLGVFTPGSALGSCAILGDRVWDVQGHACLRLKGLSHQQFLDFSPGGRLADQLHQLLQVLAGPALRVTFELEMAPEAAGGCRLGGEGPGGAQLGIAAWLGLAPQGSVLHGPGSAT